MKLKKLEEIKVGEVVITEYNKGIVTHKVTEIDEEDSSIIDESFLNIYPDEETELYVVLDQSHLHDSRQPKDCAHYFVRQTNPRVDSGAIVYRCNKCGEKR